MHSLLSFLWIRLRSKIAIVFHCVRGHLRGWRAFIGWRWIWPCCAVQRHRLTTKKSDVLHRISDRSTFAERLVGKRGIVGYYYGSSVYEDMSSDVLCFKTYGRSLVKVTRKTIQKWANRLSERVADEKWCRGLCRTFRLHSVQCSMRTKESTFQKRKRWIVRSYKRIGRTILRSIQTSLRPVPYILGRSHILLAVNALRHMKHGEERFVGYGNNYELNQKM